MSTTSPNMGLPIPTVGVESGPEWATLLDSCLSIIDGHSHVAGSGVPITPAAMSMTADLPMLGNNLTAVRTVRFSAQPAALALAGDVGCLYEAGSDLYYNDGNGTQIRITQSGSVTGAAGTITGLPSGTASASFTAINGTYVFQSATNTAADVDVGSVVLRNTSPNSTYSVALSAPAGLGANSAITLPSLPASSAPLIMDSSGAITASVALMGAFCPTGVILPFGGTSTPTGWLSCDGSAVSRATYVGLFSAVGTAFGSGDGSTTFNIPDFRGRFMRGVDGGANRDPNHSGRIAMNTGGNTGNSVGSVQADATAVKGLSDTGHVHPPLTGSTIAVGNPFLSSNATVGVNFAVPNGYNTTTGTGYSVLTGDAETRPINAYVNYIIKT